MTNEFNIIHHATTNDETSGCKKTWVNLIDYATGVEDTCLYVDLVDTLISYSLSTGTYMYIRTCNAW